MGDQNLEDASLIIQQLQEENRSLKLQIEEKNHISELEVYKQLLIEAQKNSKIGFWNYSFNDHKLFCSDAVYAIFEIDNLVDLSNIDILKQFLTDKDAEHIIMQSFQNQTRGNSFDVDFHIQVKDGNSKFVSVKSKIERDSQGNRIKAVGTITDITESQYELEELQKNEQLFRSLFTNLTDIFFIVELIKDKNDNVTDYLYKDVNPVFEMKFDLLREEIINKRFSNQEQLFQQFHPIFKMVAITQVPYQDRFFVQSLDSFLDVLIYSPSENLIATIWRDVSLMVEANTTLLESEEKYRQIFSIGNDGLFLIDLVSSRILDVNPAACSIFGFSKEELLQINFKELFESPSELEHKIQDEKLTHIIETNQKNDGTKFPTESSLTYFNWSGRKVVVVSIRDISERIKAQEDLIKSEKKFKQLFDYSNDAILIVRDYKIIDFNQKTQLLFNLPAELIRNKTLWKLSPENQANGEDSRMKIVEYLQNSLNGNQLQFDWIFQRSDKTVFSADLKLSPIIFETEKVVQVIVRDVSPQRKLELERKTREERGKYAFEISATGVWDWNVFTNEVYFSSGWKKMIGYEKDEIENKFEEFEKRIHPDDMASVFSSIESYISGKTYNFSIEFRLRCKNGSYKWINSKGKINSYTVEGKPEHFIGIHSDITRQKVIVQEYQSVIENYAFAANISKLGYWYLDLRTMILTGSEQTFSIFGFSNINQTSLKHIEELVHPEDQKQFISQFISYTNTEKITYSFRIIINSLTRFILSNSKPIYKEKTLTGFQGVFQDITSFKKQDIQLKDEQILINQIAEKTPQTIIIYLENEIVYINNNIIELTGYSRNDYKTGEQTVQNLFVYEDRKQVSNSIEQVLKNRQGQVKIEVRIETKYHKTKWVELYISSFDYNGNNAIMFIINNINDHKNLAIQLTETNITSSSIISNSPYGFAIFNKAGKISFLNYEFEQLTGIKSSDPIKENIRIIFKENNLNDFLTGIENIINNNTDQYHDECLLMNHIWVSLKVIPLYLKDRKQENFIIYVENIDIVKKHLEFLTKENLITKSLLENSGIGIGIFHENQKLKFFNQNLFDLFGFESTNNSLTYPDFNLATNNKNLSFAQIVQENKPVQIAINSAENRKISVILHPQEIDSLKTMSLFATDITKSTNLQEKANQKLQKFMSIFELAPVGIALIDKNRNITLCNQEFCKIIGQDPKDVTVKKFDQLIPTEYLSHTITKFAELFAGITPSFSQTLQIVNPENETRWISINNSPLKDNFNDILFGIQVIEDITHKRLTEEILINDEKIKTLNHLANSFAHEFNNLLMSIYGNSYLLKSNLNENIHLSGYANSLFDSINKATELTHKLLSFSQSENSIHVVTNVPKLIDEVIDNLSISSTITVKTYFEDENRKLLGNPTQLRRAIQNIIENSIESMPKGGELTIATKTVYFQENSRLIPELEKGKYLRISIKDSGCGISQNEISKIFDPFYTTKSTQLNSGLGLTIALKTITNHKGIIKVESTLKKGSEFKIFLAQSDKNLIESTIQPDEQLLVKGTANILMVDDEDIVRIVTAELLKKLGYNVFSFGNPKKAIQFYKENINNIDLVILDKQMPIMDGLEVYKKLNEINPAINIILLTGYNPDAEMENIFSQKKNGLIQKPVSVEKLSQTISALLLKK